MLLSAALVVSLYSSTRSYLSYRFSEKHIISSSLLRLLTDPVLNSRRLDPHKIAAAAAFVASKVNSAVFGVGQPQSAVKWTWLANYIEQLAR
jgi:hypothetical protein